MTEVRFFLDEHLDVPIVAALGRLGIEATNPTAQGRRSLSDESHFEWAMAAGWVIVTRDKDFFTLCQRFEHAGVVFCPRPHRHTVGEFARLLAQLAERETMESMRDQLRYV